MTIDDTKRSPWRRIRRFHRLYAGEGGGLYWNGMRDSDWRTPDRRVDISLLRNMALIANGVRTFESLLEVSYLLSKA